MPHHAVHGPRPSALAATLLLATLATGGPAVAQRADTAGTPIVIGRHATLHSSILDEDRKLLIHLPNGYAEHPDERYPVMILLDGDAHIVEATGIVESLAANWRVPEMIIVGVPNTDRTRDLTPPATSDSVRMKLPYTADSVTQHFPTAGGADRFLRFLTEELRPWVAAHYRTLPYHVLVGHSFGGLFALHVLMDHPAAYEAYLAVSPSLWWNDASLVAAAPAALPGLPLAGHALYITVGDEGPIMLDPISTFAADLDRAHPAGLRWWFHVRHGESHNSNPHGSMYDGLDSIFAPWAVPDSLIITADVPAIESHFAALSTRLGTDVPVPERLLEMVGGIMLQIGQPEKALPAFRQAAADHPRSSGARAGLGEALAATGHPRDAAAVFEEAAKLATAAHDTASAARYHERAQKAREAAGTPARGGAGPDAAASARRAPRATEPGSGRP